jgi:hypothetical protein
MKLVSYLVVAVLLLWRRALYIRNWDSIPGGDKRFFSTPQRPERHWGPASLLSNGYGGALSPEVKRPGLEADRDNFTFTFSSVLGSLSMRISGVSQQTIGLNGSVSTQPYR